MPLKSIDIDANSLPAHSRQAEQERAIAIYDTLVKSHFHPHDDDNWFVDQEFALGVSLIDQRLALSVTGDGFAKQYIVSLNPFEALFRDYQMICDAYETALRNATASQTEAIDMGRRGIHNEGADLLIERLKGKLVISHETARRLFTLFYQLRQKR